MMRFGWYFEATSLLVLLPKVGTAELSENVYVTQDILRITENISLICNKEDIPTNNNRQLVYREAT